MTGRGGSVALVTGAGCGIGAEAALRFASAGVAVAVLDIRTDAAAEIVARVVTEQERAIAIAADVADAPPIGEAAERTVGELGGIHVLYNNAGVDSRGSVAIAEQGALR